MNSRKNSDFSWNVEASVFGNRTVVVQTALVFMIPILFIIVLLTALELFESGLTLDFFYSMLQLFLILTAIFFIITVVGVFLLMGNRYRYRFTIDPEKGIYEKPEKRQQKKNNWTNSSLFLLGLLSGNYSAAGAGALAASRQQQFVRWKDISRIETDPVKRTVSLYKNRRPLMVVFCLPENYEQVYSTIKEKTGLI